MAPDHDEVTPRHGWGRLFLILLVAYLLRLWLAFAGGQDFWPDEFRYGGSVNAVESALAGEWTRAAEHLIGRPEHPLFRVVGLPAAIAERLIGPSPALVAAYFSLFSTLIILLVWAIARRAGASSTEALWAAFLAASANSLFFYSRHYLPYDASLALMLAGLWRSQGVPGARTSYISGVLVGLGYLVYNGYWLVGGCILVMHTLFGGGGWRWAVRRALFSGAGLLTPVVVWLLLGRLLGLDLLSSSRHFAGSIIRGDFGLGYRVVAEYLWYSERWLLVLWLLAMAAAIVLGVRRPWPARLTWWLTAIGGIIGGLVLLSDVLPKFVVYGRLVRMVVPFVCLAAAVGVQLLAERWPPPRRRRFAFVMAGVVGLIAAANLATPLRQAFPADFSRQAATVALETTAAAPGSAYRLLFAHGIWGDIPEPVASEDVVLLQARHPLQFRPYQYESNNAAERAQINARDLSMRLVRLEHSEGTLPMTWNGYPGPVRLRVTLPRDAVGERQPLITSGRTGEGDLVYVQYLEDDQVQFGLDHWGGPGFRTPPLRVDYEREHEIVLVMGFLVPPAGDALYAAQPELAYLPGQAAVLLDGRVVWSSREEFHPSAPERILVGVNVIGGSVVGSNFTGRVAALAPAERPEWAAGVPMLLAAELRRQRDETWGAAMGPFRLRFSLPAGLPAQAQPLVSFGGPEDGAVLFLQPDAEGLVRLGYDRKGAGAAMSPPLALEPDAAQELEVWAGRTLPAAGSPLYSRHPDLARARSGMQVKLNGRSVLSVHEPSEPVADRVTFGANTVGSSVCGPYFSGVVKQVELLAGEELKGFESRPPPFPIGPEERWQGYPGPVRLRVVFPQPPPAVAEPLLVSGEAGRADFIYVQYIDSNHVRFGFDHWGVGGVLSEPVTIEPGAGHDLTISTGALMPPPDARLYVSQPEYGPLRSQLFVAIDGRPVFDQRAETYRVPPDKILAGLNPLGGSTTGERFTGEIHSVTRVSPQEVIRTSRAGSDFVREGWGGYPGPIRLRVKLAPPAARPRNLGEPLVTTGVTGGGDFIFIRHEDGMARIGVDHWGAPVRLSEPFPAPADQEHDIVISTGGLFPPESDALYQSQPELLPWRHRTIVEVDGKRVLDGEQRSHPSIPASIFVGQNPIGGSTTLSDFSGRVIDVKLADLPVAAP